MHCLAEFDNHDVNDGKGMTKAADKIREEYGTAEESNEAEMETAWDDVWGAMLDPTAVRAARVEEAECVRKMRLCTKLQTSECIKEIGGQFISLRWVDINKGDASNPIYRSRFVVRGIGIHKRYGVFAATPPLEAFEIIMSMAASCNNGEEATINDISRAFPTRGPNVKRPYSYQVKV